MDFIIRRTNRRILNKRIHDWKQFKNNLMLILLIIFIYYWINFFAGQMIVAPVHKNVVPTEAVRTAVSGHYNFLSTKKSTQTVLHRPFYCVQDGFGRPVHQATTIVLARQRKHCSRLRNHHIILKKQSPIRRFIEPSNHHRLCATFSMCTRDHLLGDKIHFIY